MLKISVRYFVNLFSHTSSSITSNKMFHQIIVLISIVAVCSAASGFTGIPTIGTYKPSKQRLAFNPKPGQPTPSEQFPYHVNLDANYDLFWSFNDTHIIFETIVKTNGYIGFGITPNGNMYPADVVVGWVKDGTPYFSDRHTTGYRMPIADAQQDWELLMAQESGNYTVLKMVRLLDTCDPDDKPINKGTTRVIFSYGDHDPASENALYYHDLNRGGKSVLFLDPPADETTNSQWPSDMISMDFLNVNHSVPPVDTEYHCTWWKVPDLGGKKHMIRFEPVIQKGHEKLLHHILLYFCAGNIDQTAVGQEYPCYTKFFGQCHNAFAAWAIGGNAFDYPDHAGYSFGMPDDPVYLMMETHYDNPDMRADFVDNSGLRLFLTGQLRQHDSALLTTGVQVKPYQIIPPLEENFISKGYCDEKCTTEALKGTPNQEIRVIGGFLHAHLAGVGVRTRIFREGKELPPILEDNSYDFNYQEQRHLPEERVIKAGDRLLTECNYDTMSRTDITFGGLSSKEEMCLSFLIYYPKMPMTNCYTRHEYYPDTINGEEVSDAVAKMDMSLESERNALKDIISNHTHVSLCYGSVNGQTIGFSTRGMKLESKTFQEYVEPPSCPTN